MILFRTASNIVTKTPKHHLKQQFPTSKVKIGNTVLNLDSISCCNQNHHLPVFEKFLILKKSYLGSLIPVSSVQALSNAGNGSSSKMVFIIIVEEFIHISILTDRILYFWCLLVRNRSFGQVLMLLVYSIHVCHVIKPPSVI